jgi:hypothetical protein
VNDISTNITTPISTAFETAASVVTTAWDGVSGFFIDIVNGIIDSINWLINELNKFNFTVGPWNLWDAQHVDLGIFGQYDIPAVGIPAVTLGIQGIPTIPRITKKAEGGFVSTGDMFIAREAGPELVGRIGNRTAVANNDQIVSGVANGVAAGQSEQNYLLRQQNEYLRAILAKESTVRVEPSAGWGRFNRQSEQMYARNAGG